MNIILVPFGYIIRLAYQLTQNYTLALLFFALVMQIVFLPFGIKQQKNQVRQAKLQPKIMAIRKKYAGRNDKVTQQKMQEETMELYQRENFNPAGGCLPLLIQMPLLIILYNIVVQPLTYITQLPSEKITEIATAMKDFGYKFVSKSNMMEIEIANFLRGEGNIAAIGMEGTLEGKLIPNFSMFGLDLSKTPSISWPLDPLILIPLVMLAALFFTQWIMKKFTYQPPEQKEAQSSLSMKIMQYSMPFISFYFSFQVAAAVGVYWIFRNVLQLLQSMLLYKIYPLPKFTEEDYKAAERSVMTSSEKKREKKQQVRSLHHIDDDDYNQPEPAKEEKAEPSRIAPAELKEDRKNVKNAKQDSSENDENGASDDDNDKQ